MAHHNKRHLKRGGKKKMRNVKKYIEEYKKKFSENDQFFGSDLSQLWNLIKGSKDPVYDALEVGLLFGFMVGYKKGKREERAKWMD